MALCASGGTLLSAWIALRWGSASFGSAAFSPAAIAAFLFALPAAALLAIACRPAIEIHETHLKLGGRVIRWEQIRRLDQTGWNVPLAVYLTLEDESRLLLLHPGSLDTSARLLLYLRRYSREALLDGVPYRQFWGEPPVAQHKQLPLARYPLLRPEDEDEVERMFQRLKTAGHLEQRNGEEK
jgi:hypothetical protein